MLNYSLSNSDALRFAETSREGRLVIHAIGGATT